MTAWSDAPFTREDLACEGIGLAADILQRPTVSRLAANQKVDKERTREGRQTSSSCAAKRQDAAHNAWTLVFCELQHGQAVLRSSAKAIVDSKKDLPLTASSECRAVPLGRFKGQTHMIEGQKESLKLNFGMTAWLPTSGGTWQR